MADGLAALPELVRLEGVGVRLGGRMVLEGIDLAVHAGEVVTVLGPNGAGKTTLARVVLGLQRPAAGRVVRRPGLRIGYVPQRLTADPVLPLTVERLMTLTGRAPHAEVQAALEEVGCGRLARQPVDTLSGGELQRVMLARALLRRPDLLVLDEPAQNVDVLGQADLYDLIAGIRRSHGCGVLMISHDLHVVMAATDRVICVNGHLCCSGTPDAISRDPRYLSLFGTAAAHSLAVYYHAHGHRHAADGSVEPISACGHGHRHGRDHGHADPVAVPVRGEERR
jgi:zinc transport system ATP-binding protein